MNREPIYEALWNRLSTVGKSSILTRSRRPRAPSEILPEQQPAMFLEQGTSTAVGDIGLPSRHSIHCNIGIYAYVDSDEGPAPLLNSLVAEVEAALKAQPDETRSRAPGATTLGDTVSSARVVEVTFGNAALGAQGFAVLDIEILVAG